MKRNLWLIGLCVAAVLGMAVPADAALKHFTAYVHRDFGSYSDPITYSRVGGSDIQYQVLAKDSTTEETLYSDAGLTTKTNPVTATVFGTDGYKIEFWCDPTDSDDSYVDLIVVDNVGGFTTFVEDFSTSHRTIIIDERPNVMHTGCIWLTYPNNSSKVKDTGIKFKNNTVVHWVRPFIVTAMTRFNTTPGDEADQHKSVDVGILSTQNLGATGSGVENGFITGWPIYSGFAEPEPKQPASWNWTSAIGRYLSASQASGIGSGNALPNNATLGGSMFTDTDLYRPSLSYTINTELSVTTSDTDVFFGYIYWAFTVLR